MGVGGMGGVVRGGLGGRLVMVVVVVLVRGRLVVVVVLVGGPLVAVVLVGEVCILGVGEEEREGVYIPGEVEGGLAEEEEGEAMIP